MSNFYFVRVTPEGGGIELINLVHVVRVIPVDLTNSFYQLCFVDGEDGIYRLTVSALRSIILAQQGSQGLEDIGRYE